MSQTAEAYRSLSDILRQRAAEMPDQLAYQFLVDGQTEGDRLTFDDLDRKSTALASRLLSIAKRGESALLLYPQGCEFLVAFFGCLRAGIIAVPLPPPDTARLKRSLPRLESIIRDAQASLVLSTGKIYDALVGHFDDVAGFRELCWINTDEVSDIDLQQDCCPDEIAFLQYTSGSTSTPKGVIVSHSNVLHQCRILTAAAGYNERSITATWMPYHHDYGLIEGLIVPLFVGIPCYFMSPLAFIKRPIRWLEAISRFKVTHSQAPNFAYDLSVTKTTPDQRTSLDLNSWIVAANAAEPVRRQTLYEFFEAFKDCGLRWESLCPAYGLAESTLIVSHSDIGKAPTWLDVETKAFERGALETSDQEQDSRSIVSCGCVLEDMRVEVVNPDTCQPCPPNEVGEIWVKGGSVARGYWNRSEESRKTFNARLTDTDEGPFLRTGDLGCLKNGELYVTGRHKDLIIIRGLNHYPQDIELTVERSHPALRSGFGAAFSVDVNGEEEVVVVQEVQGKGLRHLDSDAVLSSIRTAVFDEHELRVHAVAMLKPGGILKTTSGKIQRRAVKAGFLAGRLDTVSLWQADRQSDTLKSCGASTDDSSRNAASLADVREGLAKRLAKLVGVEPTMIDMTRRFADFGLDSLRAVDLANNLELWLNRRVDPTVFWNYSTVDALALHLAGQVIVNQQVEKQTHARWNPASQETIAIIGLGCRFPGGVDSPEKYWELLRDGVDAISEIPESRWDVDAYYDADPEAVGKMYTRHGGFIENVDQFDPAFFGITPREAHDVDPQQRLLLEVAWESLEHAGIGPSSLRGTDAGVFVGMSSDDHATWQHNGNGLAELDAYRTLGTARSIAAGRVAYVLGLHGPVVQLDTACSSSLVAVHQACQSLQAGDCDLAMAGGVNLMLSPATMVALCKLTALAPDGRCKTFDAAANGYVRGEGCGMVVLKRLTDAEREGDNVLAVIRAAAINHDGASNGLTAPNPIAQERLVRSALRKAGLCGNEVTYVEAHGTGTELGDPIELESLNRVYGEQRTAANRLYVGSMKTNIGHLEAAAGIAGLIKVVLMLRHGAIPPQLHFEVPNPHIAWDEMPIEVPTKLISWPNGVTRRLAAVSSFGFSGTNAHVIVEAPENHVTEVERLQSDDRSNASRILTNPAAEETTAPLHLFTLSAGNDTALKSLTQKYHDHIKSNPHLCIEDICYTAATARDHFQHRLAVVAASRDELLEKLRAYDSETDSPQAIRKKVTSNGASTSQNVAFLFTGQGSQYVGMGGELYKSQPVFRSAMDRCDKLLRQWLDVALIELLYSDEIEDDGRLNQTIFTQPALFALQFALVELWKSWGVTPTAALGHSSGEYAAACAAGVFDLETGLELISTRGRLIHELPQTGEMAVVMADESTVKAAISPFGIAVSIASINGPDTIVISGEQNAVQNIVEKFKAAGVDTETLKTSNAGHSKLMEPMLDSFRKVADRASYSTPRIALFSNISGQLAGDEVAHGSYWAQHIRSTVRFADGMNALAATEVATFIEIGPNPNLLAMGMGCVKDRQTRRRWLPSLTKGRNGWETMLYSLADLYVHGININWRGFHAPYSRDRVSLPTYAFQLQSFGRNGSNGDSCRVVSQGAAKAVEDGFGKPSYRRSALPAPSSIASEVSHLQTGLEDESRALAPHMDAAAIRFVIQAMKDLDFTFHPGAEFSQAEIASRVPERHRAKVRRVLSRLVERDILEQQDYIYKIVAEVAKLQDLNSCESSYDESEYPEWALLNRAGRALASIWRGDVEPLTILFPDGATNQAMRFYSEAKLLSGYNRLAGEVVREAIAALPSDEKVRVLEIGAGTGGLTTHLLPQLGSHCSEYVFTDVSPLFLRAAEQRFDTSPFLQTKLLDISKPAVEQGFDTSSFDLVIAANVLHATPRLHKTLAHVRQLLKPGGWLMLLEGANPPLWGDMIFTLIDGWWCFEDKELRADYPLMRRDRWCKVLNETGFDEVACLNDAKFKDDSNHTLYLAAATGCHPVGSSPVKNHLLVTSQADEPGPQRSEGNVAPDLADEDLLELVRKHAARVMRLQPDDIDPQRPLSELGMDSLMAVELRTHLGNALGFELSLNPLRMRRSVNEISAYIKEDRTAPQKQQVPQQVEGRLANLELHTARVLLVPLQSKGDKTPLFFVPAGYGDLLAFEDIASALGANQPVYGLQPASAKQVKTIRQMSIYRLVSAYISEIKNVQKTGPYFLSGYSAGAIIAVEIARELIRQGNEVGLLVIFDPPSHVPFWLDWLYSISYRICFHTGLIPLVRRVRMRYMRRLFHTVLDEGLRTHTTVTREHRVAPYPGRITHFRARLSQSGLVSLKRMGKFWQRLAKDEVEVHWIPGTHYGMLRGPGASVVVDELYDCLQRANRRETS